MLTVRLVPFDSIVVECDSIGLIAVKSRGRILTHLPNSFEILLVIIAFSLFLRVSSFG